MLRKVVYGCLAAALSIIFASCSKDEFPQHRSTSLEHTISLDGLSARKGRCLSDEKMQSIYERDVHLKSEIMRGRQEIMQWMSRNHGRSVADEELLTVPVHVIVVHRSQHAVGQGTNIPDARIHSQIEALNQDFLRQNNDASRTPGVFPVSNTRIQFCLANVSPNGAPTTGITRYAYNGNFEQNELSIVRNTGWDHRLYLNIWVAPDIDGLGYASLPSPSSLPGEYEDVVVILTEAFGGPNAGASAPFNLGRTLTHEVGHYLGLDHIWGDGCQIDDGIDDTPQQRAENYECPQHPSPSCSNGGDMFMNYMDYTDDACMNAFSTGQATYMRHILATARQTLTSPGRTACSAGPEDPSDPVSTCDDGIRNGTETGVDCGGRECAPCETGGTNDAGIAAVSAQSQQDGCGGEVVLIARLQNFGSTTLRRVRLTVSTAGHPIAAMDWQGSLAPRASSEIALPAIQLGPGEHAVSATTERPNGTTDSNPANDGMTTAVSSTGGQMMHLVIQPDDYGADISWRIKNEAGKTVASGGGYPDFDHTLIEESFCLPAGCYRLIMRDSYGDGLCCDYGEGRYQLLDHHGAVIFASDGYYGYRESFRFCIEGTTVTAQRHTRDRRAPTARRDAAQNPTAVKSSN